MQELVDTSWWEIIVYILPSWAFSEIVLVSEISYDATYAMEIGEHDIAVLHHHQHQENIVAHLPAPH